MTSDVQEIQHGKCRDTYLKNRSENIRMLKKDNYQPEVVGMNFSQLQEEPTCQKGPYLFVIDRIEVYRRQQLYLHLNFLQIFQFPTLILFLLKDIANQRRILHHSVEPHHPCSKEQYQ
jgi:hypothetical protein